MSEQKKYIDLTGLQYFWKEAQDKIKTFTVAQAVKATQDGNGDNIVDTYLKSADAETTYLSQDTFNKSEASKFKEGNKDTYDKAVTNINANEINKLIVTAPTGQDSYPPSPTEILTNVGKDYTLHLDNFAVKTWVEKHVETAINAAKREHLSIYVVEDGDFSHIPDDKLNNLTIYLVKGDPTNGHPGSYPAEEKASNSYVEYIYLGKKPNGKFEKIGTTEVDWSNYYTKADINSKVSTLTTSISDVSDKVATLESTAGTHTSEISGLNSRLETAESKITGNTQAIESEATARTASDEKYDAILAGFGPGDGLEKTVKAYIDQKDADDRAKQAEIDTKQTNDIADIKAAIGMGDIGESQDKGITGRVAKLETTTEALNNLTAGTWTLTNEDGSTTSTIKDYVDAKDKANKDAITSEAGTRESAITGLDGRLTEVETTLGKSESEGLRKAVADNATNISTINGKLGAGFDTGSSTVAKKIEAVDNKFGAMGGQATVTAYVGGIVSTQATTDKNQDTAIQNNATAIANIIPYTNKEIATQLGWSTAGL